MKHNVGSIEVYLVAATLAFIAFALYSTPFTLLKLVGSLLGIAAIIAGLCSLALAFEGK